MDKLHFMAANLLVFHCPGCKHGHQISVNGPNAWSWNGSLTAPTFSPSILIQSGHYIRGHQPGACWCSYNAEHPDDPSGFSCSCCHSFVADGKIQFLNDCTHEFAGQTVEIPNWAESSDFAALQ